MSKLARKIDSTKYSMYQSVYNGTLSKHLYFLFKSYASFFRMFLLSALMVPLYHYNMEDSGTILDHIFVLSFSLLYFTGVELFVRWFFEPSKSLKDGFSEKIKNHARVNMMLLRSKYNIDNK